MDILTTPNGEEFAYKDPEPMQFIYEMTHPQLSEPLYFDSYVERTPKALAAWATLHIAKQFDLVVDPAGWTIEQDQPTKKETSS